jgi:integrase
MNIQLKSIGKKEFNKLSVRIYQGFFDISYATDIMVEKKSWDNKKQVSKNEVLNIKIQKLKIHIAEQISNSYMEGEIIDRDWLVSIISKYFSRNSGEKNFKNPDHKIYFHSFSRWWLDNHSQKWKVSASKFMGERLKEQYSIFLKKVDNFESLKERVKFQNITNDFMYDFAFHLKSLNYGPGTIDKNIAYLKFFCNRATEFGFSVNQEFKQRVFIDNENKDIEGVYLNELEIDKIYNLDLSSNDHLDNVRDLLILSVWSGLRISDFLYNLKTDNIKDGFIEIKTQKTKTFVKIPVHGMVRKVLDKRFGQLPKKMSSTEYNLRVKEVCMLSEIDELVFGSLMNPGTRRKENGYYKKYQLISSHTARRSFATNLYGKVSDEVIKSICGWSNFDMLNHYNKKSKTDYAKELQEFWSK